MNVRLKIATICFAALSREDGALKTATDDLVADFDRLFALGEQETKALINMTGERDRLRAERNALLAEKNHLKDWKERAFKAEDEMDRLRDELATWKKAHIELGEMYDHLRTELAKANKLIERCFDDNYDSGCFRIGTAKAIDDYLETAKEGE